MFLISQGVLHSNYLTMEQLCRMKLKGMLLFYFCHVTASHMKYSSCLCGPVLFKDAYNLFSFLFLFFLPVGTRTALACRSDCSTLALTKRKCVSNVLIFTKIPVTVFLTSLSFNYATIGFSNLINCSKNTGQVAQY